MKIKNLGIIAGSGDLPRYAVDEAFKIKKERNIKFTVYFLNEESNVLAHGLTSRGIVCRKISLGKFDDVINRLKNDQISHVLIVGKIHKKNLLNDVRFNLKTLALLKKVKDFNDSSLFNLVSDEFKKVNVEILKQDDFLSSLLCAPGVHSKKKPTKSELADIDYGMNFAKKIAALDIGQTVVVANKTLLSVEAIEGTDEAIKRGGLYAGKKTAVVCKAMRKNQDTRFDVPAVGLHTLEAMRQSGCRVLAIEAKRTFVADRDKFIQKINEYKMVFIAV
jgi:hypothetical protein